MSLVHYMHGFRTFERIQVIIFFSITRVASIYTIPKCDCMFVPGCRKYQTMVLSTTYLELVRILD